MGKWTVWILAIVVSFAVLEWWSVAHETPTLSYYVWHYSQAWPPLTFLLGALCGGLCVHFWWRWDPRVNKPKGYGHESDLEKPR